MVLLYLGEKGCSIANLCQKETETIMAESSNQETFPVVRKNNNYVVSVYIYIVHCPPQAVV